MFTVRQDDLPIVVRENAELQALRETIVRSEVEGQATIIYIVAEGAVVKQGEKLVELDVSELVVKASTQEIAVEKAKSALEQGRTQQGILEKELTTKRNTASSQLRIARMELDKLLGARGGTGSEGKNSDMLKRLRELTAESPEPVEPADATGSATAGGPRSLVTRVNPRNYAGLVDRAATLLELKLADGQVDAFDRDMGEMANKILQQADQIRLAMADLKVKEETWSHSRRLAAKKFITRNELDRDELAFQSQASKVTIAWNDLELLVNYTLQRDRIKLTQDYENATLELERVDASNDAERKKSEFDVEAKAKEYTLASERLDNLKRQIKSAVILAPTPGTVVYARIDRNRGGGEAVREGVQVRERQELIILPDTTKMRCNIKVQEAQVDKVVRGQAAHVSVEAFQGETFTGRVTSVAPVADSNSGWMTSDRKVYTTIVELDSENPDGRLRSRMAANVTISVDTVQDTLPVPLQAVFRDRSVNYVWQQTADGPKATPVKVGRQNTERVEILGGVAAGDVLHLIAPQGVQAPKFEQPVAPEPAPLKEPEKAPGNGQGPGDGQRGTRGPGMGMGMGASNKKLADMTPEELDTYKGRLDGMQRMVDNIRESGSLDVATEMEATIASLREALGKNDLVAGQTHKDKLSALMMRSRGNRQGGPGGNGGNGGDGGDRPRRGGGDAG
ncbi:MAG: efflux RND transporter periplasmic adaptor subunit, partial [Planctomycetota bacterium]